VPIALDLLHLVNCHRIPHRTVFPGTAPNLLLEADDGKRGGWSHREFARALSEAVSAKPVVLPSPGIFLRLAVRADQWWRGENAKVTPDRAAYFSHSNWVVEPKRAPPPELWRAQIDISQGLGDTAKWYTDQCWL
jgi:hypothetical protein